MIEFVYSDSIRRLFEKVANSPGRVREVVVSSPFIDEVGMDLLRRIAGIALRSGFRVRVLTTVQTSLALRRELRRRDVVCVRGLENLHAKLYGVLGRDPREHELVVTSANLTRAGLYRNLEVGLRLSSSTAETACLIEKMVRWTHIKESAAAPAA